MYHVGASSNKETGKRNAKATLKTYDIGFLIRLCNFNIV
jgi:hypothetical protein